MIEILTKWALPVLLAALLGFIVWRKQKEEERFQMAKDRLHAAFDPTLGRLAFARDYKSTHEAPDIDSQLDSALPMQTEAIESYRRFVPKDGQPEYDKAWDDYRGWAKKSQGVFAARYVIQEDPKFIIKEDPHDFIAKKIHTILHFAKEK